jgi:hypothetical protein
MNDATAEHSRRLEILFAQEDEAIVLDVSENPDAAQVATLIKALEASSINEAESRLRGIATGAKPSRRFGSHRRSW